MQLPPFRLDHWLEAHKHRVQYDLASSTGASWRYADAIQAMDALEREALDSCRLGYGDADGSPALREAVAAHCGAEPAHVLVVTGASEAMHLIFAEAAVAGGNVVVPMPAFAPLAEMPRALGLDVRRYHLAPERNFAIDLDEVADLVDDRTQLLLVNTPHNPTGALVGARELRTLHDLAVAHGARLVSDEVYWPLAYGTEAASASLLPQATVVGSLSKAASMAGLRCGWIVERDEARRAQYLNRRMYYTIAGNPVADHVAACCLRRASAWIDATRRQSAANRERLIERLRRHEALIDLVPPAGGTTAFPRLRFADDARPFCEALAAEGVLVAPGDCFEMPAHLRIGFGAATEMTPALDILESVLAAAAAAVP
jgi:aspartate/methionine/tyrosine aminotransferase